MPPPTPCAPPEAGPFSLIVSPSCLSNSNQRGSRQASRLGSQRPPAVSQMISVTEKPLPIASRISNISDSSVSRARNSRISSAWAWCSAASLAASTVMGSWLTCRFRVPSTDR